MRLRFYVLQGSHQLLQANIVVVVKRSKENCEVFWSKTTTSKDMPVTLPIRHTRMVHHCSDTL